MLIDAPFSLTAIFGASTMSSADDKNYMVPFKGALLSRRQANVVGVSLISGMAVSVACAVLGIHKHLSYLVIVIVGVIGYWMGERLFPKRNTEENKQMKGKSPNQAL